MQFRTKLRRVWAQFKSCCDDGLVTMNAGACWDQLTQPGVNETDRSHGPEADLVVAQLPPHAPQPPQ